MAHAAVDELGIGVVEVGVQRRAVARVHPGGRAFVAAMPDLAPQRIAEGVKRMAGPVGIAPRLEQRVASGGDAVVGPEGVVPVLQHRRIAVARGGPELVVVPLFREDARGVGQVEEEMRARERLRGGGIARAVLHAARDLPQPVAAVVRDLRVPHAAVGRLVAGLLELRFHPDHGLHERGRDAQGRVLRLGRARRPVARQQARILQMVRLARGRGRARDRQPRRRQLDGRVVDAHVVERLVGVEVVGAEAGAGGARALPRPGERDRQHDRGRRQRR